MQLDRWLQLRRDAYGTPAEMLVFIAFLIALTAVAFSRYLLSSVKDAPGPRADVAHFIVGPKGLSLVDSKGFTLAYVHSYIHGTCLTRRHTVCTSAYAGQQHSEFHESLRSTFSMPHFQDASDVVDWMEGSLLDTLLPIDAFGSATHASHTEPSEPACLLLTFTCLFAFR